MTLPGRRAIFLGMNHASLAPVVGIGLSTTDLLFLVDERPGFGPPVRAERFLRQGGGPVATALVALARLGVPTRFISRIGDDEEGAFMRAEFQREGVDTSLLESQAGTLSQVALVLVERATGERGFTFREPTCTPLEPGDLDRSAITGARLLHLDDAEPAQLQAARWAREAGVPVMLDGTWVHEDLPELLQLVDASILSDVMARRWMPGATPQEVVQRLRNYGARIAVLTRGEEGCLVQWDQGRFAFDAFAVDVVDTTGAGDAFHGGFIYGLLQDWPVEKTVCFAQAVAALNCGHFGGRTGLPTLEQVESLMAAQTPTPRPLT